MKALVLPVIKKLHYILQVTFCWRY